MKKPERKHLMFRTRMFKRKKLPKRNHLMFRTRISIRKLEGSIHRFHTFVWSDYFPQMSIIFDASCIKENSGTLFFRQNQGGVQDA